MRFVTCFAFDRQALFLWESLHNTVDQLSSLMVHSFITLLSIHLTYWHVIRERWFSSTGCTMGRVSIIYRPNTILRKVSRWSWLLMLHLLRLTRNFQKIRQSTHGWRLTLIVHSTCNCVHLLMTTVVVIYIGIPGFLWVLIMLRVMIGAIRRYERSTLLGRWTSRKMLLSTILLLFLITGFNPCIDPLTARTRRKLTHRCNRVKLLLRRMWL